MGRDVQSDDGRYVVKVQAGNSADRGTPTSDFIIADRDDPHGHQHVVLDDRGEEFYNQYNANTPRG